MRRKKRKRKIYQFSKRNVNQIALDAIYRLGAKENVYIGGRYNTVNGQLLASSADKQSVNRIAIGGGWFLTKNILLKAEYVDQKYNDYPQHPSLIKADSKAV